MMSESAVRVPWWMGLAAFAFGFLIVAVFLLARMSPQARAKSLFWVFGGLGVAFLVFLTVGVTTVREMRMETRGAPPDHPSPAIGVPAQTTSVAVHQSQGTVEYRNPLAAVAEFWPGLEGGRVNRIVVILMVIGFALIAWSKSKSTTAAVAAAKPADAKSGVSWLVVPAAGLGVLTYLAAPTLLPRRNPEMTTPPVISAATQEKMDKIVRNLIAKSEEPDSPVKVIPDWIKNKQHSPHQFLLSSQQYGSKEEAEAELMPLATELLQRAFHQRLPWQGTWIVPAAQLRERVVQADYLQLGSVSSGKGPQETFGVHWLIDVSPEKCESFTAVWKQQIVERRLKVLGVLVGWLSVILLMSRAYFWSLTLPERNHYWANTLKASVMAAGVTGLAGWALIDFIH